MSGASNGCNDGAPSQLPTNLSTIPLGYDDAALNIATYLSASDTHTLSSVNKGWHTLLTIHEDQLYTKCLIRDYVEGTALSYIANKHDVSMKKLYFAFNKRWNLTTECDKRVCINWRKPYRPRSRIIDNGRYDSTNSYDRGEVDDDDISSLVFIARVGNKDDLQDTNIPQATCVVMDWSFEYDGSGKRQGRHKMLKQEYAKMYDSDDSDDENYGEYEEVGNGVDDGGLMLPYDDLAQNLLYDGSEGNDNWFKELQETMVASHSLTLHVIDIRTIQIMTLMDQCKAKDGVWLDHDNIPIATRGYHSLKLYGLPPKSSFFYRDFSEEEYKKFEGEIWFSEEDWSEYYSKLEHFEIRGGLHMNFEYILSLISSTEHDGLHFIMGKKSPYHSQNSSIHEQSDVCNYLRALMKEKCFLVEPADHTPTPILPSPQQQPLWVQNDAVLDRVISYASFEDQVGKLRLVCHQFQDASLRQLCNKLNNMNTIIVDDGYRFKASIHRSWTESHLTSKESAIDDAVWLASCRCKRGICGGINSCPSVGNVLRHNSYRTELSKDVSSLRDELERYGHAYFEQPDYNMLDYCESLPRPNLECSVKRSRINMFHLCDKVESTLHEKMDLDGLMLEDYRPCRLNGYVPSGLGVSTNIVYLKQFIRTLFLLLAKQKGMNTQGDETATKKARLTEHIEELTVGTAKANICDGTDTYHHEMKIFRFYLDEPVEISMEYRYSYSNY